MEPRVCVTAGRCLILHATKQFSLPLERGVFDARTIATVTAELLAAKLAANRRPRYVTSLRQYLEQFARGRENRPLASFTTAEIEAWLNRYPGAYARQTWLNRLSTLFAFAVRRGYLLSNPCAVIDRVTVDKKPPVILTPAQVETLLRVVPTAGRPYFILALYAGIRPEELERMDWADVNLETRTVRVDGKTRQRRIVPLSEKAVALLSVCPLRRGPVAPSHMTLRRMKRRAAAVLGFAQWPQDLLRHTAASYLLALHQDAGKVATMLGNSPAVLLSHYHEPVNEADCTQFWKNDALGLDMSDVSKVGGASARSISTPFPPIAEIPPAAKLPGKPCASDRAT